MWIVRCKPGNDSQSWSTLGSYENKENAISHAIRVSQECYMVIVTDPSGSVIWNK